MVKSSKLALHQFEINKIYTITLQRFVVKHQRDFKLQIYQGVASGFKEDAAHDWEIVSAYLHENNGDGANFK